MLLHARWFHRLPAIFLVWWIRIINLSNLPAHRKAHDYWILIIILSITLAFRFGNLWAIKAKPRGGKKTQRREGRMCHETARSRFLFFSPLEPQFIICRADCLMHFYVSSKARNLSSTFRARLDSLRYGQLFYISTWSKGEQPTHEPHTIGWRSWKSNAKCFNNGKKSAWSIIVCGHDHNCEPMLRCFH